MLQIQSFVFNAFSENTYLLINENKECWIVDPGMYDAGETKKFTDFLEREGLQPQAIINTHAHIDHIFGIPALMERYSLPFGMHQADMPVLQGAKGAAMLFGFHIQTIPQPTFFIREGEALQLGGDTLEVRLAPGHSPGSVVFYYAPGKWLIGGDVLFAGGIGRTDLPGGHHQTLLDSIRTELMTLPDDTEVFAGHGPATTIGREKATNPYLDE
jgi:glyoxylase-like metal-dependent hydrolase (beta-lactamase superfamily II)